MPRCRGIRGNQVPCQQNTNHPSGYCHWHRNQAQAQVVQAPPPPPPNNPLLNPPAVVPPQAPPQRRPRGMVLPPQRKRHKEVEEGKDSPEYISFRKHASDMMKAIEASKATFNAEQKKIYRKLKKLGSSKKEKAKANSLMRKLLKKKKSKKDCFNDEDFTNMEPIHDKPYIVLKAPGDNKGTCLSLADVRNMVNAPAGPNQFRDPRTRRVYTPAEIGRINQFVQQHQNPFVAGSKGGSIMDQIYGY